MPRHNPAEQETRARAIAFTLAASRLLEILDNELSKRVPLSPKGEAEGKRFEHRLNELRICEEKALHLLGEKTVEKLLRDDPLTLPKSSGDRPATLEAMEAFTTKHESLAYVITEKHEFTYLSKMATQLMGFAGSQGTPLDELNMRIAGNLLPKKSFFRNPQQDYLLLQRMLRALARTSAYQIPKISLLIRLAEKDSSKVSYHKATVKAEHCFSPEPKKQFLGTICQVTGLETNITPADYETALRDDVLIPLLPDDLKDMVQNRLEILQKALRDARDKARVSLLELEAVCQNMPDAIAPIRTDEDLSRLFNLAAFRQAVVALPQTLESMDTLHQADDFIVKQIRAVVQDEIKRRLWPGQEIPGIVSFSTSKEEKPSNTYHYLRASTNGKTKNVRPSTMEEIEKYDKDKALESHVSRASKTGRTRA